MLMGWLQLNQTLSLAYNKALLPDCFSAALQNSRKARR
jgi:hypothetical protein